MARSSVENDPAIQNLIKWVESTEARGLRIAAGDSSGYDWNVPYVSRTALDQYFSLEAVTELLHAFFDPHDPRCEGLDAGEIKRKYSKIFCLLITIGKGHFITNFVQYRIDDQRLPIGPNKPDNFPSSTSDPDYFSTFYKKQWQYCVPELGVVHDRRYEPRDLILPIRRVKQIGEGGSATAHLIEVLGSYYQLEEGSNDWHHGDCQNSCRHPPATFVLKCYRDTSDIKRYYENEWRALKRVHTNKCPNIVGCYGSFTLGGVHNVLLEYADHGTLEDFMKNTHPPSTAKDVNAFYGSILLVTRGLLRIHNQAGTSLDVPQIFQGWHHDITPRNILIKSRKEGSTYDFDCKLADLGLSHFRRFENRLQGDTDRDPHGTRTYGKTLVPSTLECIHLLSTLLGPPECFRYDSSIDNEDLLVKQNADVYSLGCVLSVVTTWVARNWLAVLEYRDQRQKEIKGMSISREGDDFFHNGQDALLAAVTNNHADLEESVRPCDNITKPVLKMVQEDMLTALFRRRDATYLCKQAVQIIEQAKNPCSKNRPTSSASRIVTQDNDSSHIPGTILTPPKPSQANGRLNFNPPPQSPHRTDRIYGQSLRPTAPATRDRQSYPSSEEPREHPFFRENESGDGGNDDPEQTRSLSVKSKTFPHPLPRGPTSITPNIFPFPERPPSAASHHSPKLYTSDSAEPTNSLEGNRLTQNHLVTSLPLSKPKDPQSTQSSTSAMKESAQSSTTTNHRGTHYIPNANSLPVWHVEKALHWKSVKKDRKNNENVCIPSKHFLEGLKERDHSFLIDNSSSMLNTPSMPQSYWSKARNLLDLLGYLVKKYDRDGLDIYFTCPFREYLNVKTTTHLLAIFDENKPFGNDRVSDMSATLSNIVGKYQKVLAKIHERKSISARVMSPVCEVSPVIKSLVNTLNQQNLHKQQVGIQFIRFGDQPQYQSRLEALDRLKLSGFVDIDIVDTEPATGNVFKMLFGAINPWFDDDTPLVEAVVTSPIPSPQQPDKRFSSTVQPSPRA